MEKKINVRTFCNALFGNMMVLEDSESGEPWFFSTEVAGALGYSNVWDAITKHVDPEDIRKLPYKECPPELRPGIWAPSDFRAKVLINESGVYALAFSSRLATARDFRRWVTKEVLPEIRKNGGYVLGQEELDPEELETLRGTVRKLSEQVSYLRSRRRILRQEAGQLKQEKRDLKQKNKVLRSEASAQMDYYLGLIDECAKMEDEIQRMKNILHIRTVKKSDAESEAEKSVRDAYSVNSEGFRVVGEFFGL